MAQLTEEEKQLIKEAHYYIYHVVFKEDFFHPSHDVTVFTLPQLITAFREGFDYKGRWEEKPRRYQLREMGLLLIYRPGLPDFMEISQIPELKLLLSYPTPNV